MMRLRGKRKRLHQPCTCTMPAPSPPCPRFSLAPTCPDSKSAGVRYSPRRYRHTGTQAHRHTGQAWLGALRRGTTVHHFAALFHRPCPLTPPSPHPPPLPPPTALSPVPSPLSLFRPLPGPFQVQRSNCPRALRMCTRAGNGYQRHLKGCRAFPRTRPFLLFFLLLAATFPTGKPSAPSPSTSTTASSRSSTSSRPKPIKTLGEGFTHHSPLGPVQSIW